MDLERRVERVRHVDVREKHRSGGARNPGMGPDRDQTSNPLLCRMMPNQLTDTGRVLSCQEKESGCWIKTGGGVSGSHTNLLPGPIWNCN